LGSLNIHPCHATTDPFTPEMYGLLLDNILDGQHYSTVYCLKIRQIFINYS